MEYVENRGLSKTARIWIGIVIAGGLAVLVLVTAIIIFMELRTGRQLGRPLDIRSRLPITLITAYEDKPVSYNEDGITIVELIYVYEIEGRASDKGLTAVNTHDIPQREFFLILNSRLFCLNETDYPGRDVRVSVAINGVLQAPIEGRFDGGKCLGPLMAIDLGYEKDDPFPRAYGLRGGDEISIGVMFMTRSDSGGGSGTGAGSRFVVGNDHKLYRVLCENCNRSSAYDPYDP
jgi:hypothetical protein